MKLEESTAFTQKCFHEEPASCVCACPFHLNIKSFLKKMERGRYAAAYRELRTATVFPTVAAMLCPRPCRLRCQRVSVGDEALDMERLEQACIKFAGNTAPDSFAIPPKEERAAVIGAGPAGLSAALNMAQKKYNVTVFDMQEGWGGGLRGHENFAMFDEDFAKQFSVSPAEFKFGIKIESLSQVEDYDVVIIATGAGGDDFGLLSSWDEGLYTTEKDGVFIVGELCSMSLMEGIAAGPDLSRIIESYVQTGRATRIGGELGTCEGHEFDHPDEESKPIVVPADSEEGYTKDEAKSEAGRCMQCICDKCLTGCEMLAHYRKPPHKLSVDIFGDSQTTPPFSECVATRETYSCNMCGWCESVCSEGVNMGDLFQFSRESRAEKGTNPKAFHDFWLRELDFSSGEAFFASCAKGKDKCEYVFFPGCQLTASSPEHVEQAYALLSEKYDMGVILGCCGVPAKWAGERKRFEDNTEKLRAAWENMGKPVVVTACATCKETLEKLFPEAELASLYELLEKEEAIPNSKVFADAVVFDPCSARSSEAMQKSVRSLAEKAGCHLAELSDKGHCCGYGGHIKLANRKLYDKITENRAEADDKPYIVYCANCREVFASRGKECAHILDIVFGEENDGKIPMLSEKRQNSLKVKGKLMQELTGKTFEPEAHGWDNVELEISDEVAQVMEDRFISRDDLKELIWHAVKDKEFFEDGDGVCIASMIRPVITYWAEFKETGDNTYKIINAYTHRMRIGGDENK